MNECAVGTSLWSGTTRAHQTCMLAWRGVKWWRSSFFLQIQINVPHEIFPKDAEFTKDSPHVCVCMCLCVYV